MLDEAGTNARVNAQGTTAANLTPNVSISNDTVNKMEGAAAASFTADSQVMTGGAGAITAFTTAMTLGCWQRSTRSGTNERSLSLYDSGGGLGILFDHAASGIYNVFIDTSGSGGIQVATAVVAANTWHHVVTKFSAGTATVYLDGVSANTGAAAGQVGPLAGTSSVLIGNGHGVGAFWGQVDECWVTASALPDAAVCRICSCGLDGSLCSCAGSAFAATGRNATFCNSCALPAACTDPSPVPTTTSTSTSTSTSSTSTSSTTSTTLGAATFWMLDESAGNARTNVQGVTSRNLTEQGGTLANDTTTKMEGTASVVGVTARYLSTTDAVLRSTGSLTVGFWARVTTAGATMIAWRNSATLASDGYYIYWTSSDSKWKLTHQGSLWSSATAPINTWAHVVIVEQQPAGNCFIYQNGVAAGSATGGGCPITPSTATSLRVAGDGTNGFQGQMDEVFFTPVAYTAAQACRACSCGIRGEQCTCSGTSYTSTGRNAASCGSCTLPADCSVPLP